jgi:hypothetical protein
MRRAGHRSSTPVCCDFRATRPRSTDRARVRGTVGTGHAARTGVAQGGGRAFRLPSPRRGPGQRVAADRGRGGSVDGVILGKGIGMRMETARAPVACGEGRPECTPGRGPVRRPVTAGPDVTASGAPGSEGALSLLALEASAWNAMRDSDPMPAAWFREPTTEERRPVRGAVHYAGGRIYRWVVQAGEPHAGYSSRNLTEAALDQVPGRTPAWSPPPRHVAGGSSPSGTGRRPWPSKPTRTPPGRSGGQAEMPVRLAGRAAGVIAVWAAPGPAGWMPCAYWPERR